jgi:hypothetical protein
MRSGQKRKFPWIIYLLVLFAIGALALAPLGSVVVCSWIANAHGCKVDEGTVHPCVIDGNDYGQLLYTLGVLGWLMLVTLPAGALAFTIWLIVLVLHRARWRKRAATDLATLAQ